MTDAWQMHAYVSKMDLKVMLLSSSAGYAVRNLSQLSPRPTGVAFCIFSSSHYNYITVTTTITNCNSLTPDVVGGLLLRLSE
jgi:hypothetical protein